MQALDPVPDTRFFTGGASGRTAGGLFSLDGIHPTTITYGLMAQEFMDVMLEAGVRFHGQDGSTPRATPVGVDWGRLISCDTLISHPPRSLTSDLSLIGWLDERLDIISRLWAGIAGGKA